MENRVLKFPDGFLWGTATAAHQVEGNCNNSWTQWEKDNAGKLAKEAKNRWAAWQQKKFPEMFQKENYISGAACDHYNLYEKDFDLAKELGNNAHRFSVEWSRIEPSEGNFDEKEIEHYRKVILALRERGMEPFVTLWHWTEPIWFNEKGGWNNKKSAEYFSRFAEKVVSEYKNIVKFWVVINEPNVAMGFGYFLGTQPPGKKGVIKFISGFFNLLRAFKQASLKVKEIDQKAEIGIANSIVHYDVKVSSILFFAAIPIIKFFSRYFLRKSIPYCTFIGCNYYSRNMIFKKRKNIEREKINDLGWEIYPEGIYKILKKLKEYNLPIYITENGLADADDTRRTEFIKNHLKFIHQAISEGTDVRGYFHWSLLDNFEFPELRGFWPRFGLVEIDYKTFERKPRKSFYEYAEICLNNRLEIKA
jgi:beta-glucosidase